MKNKLLIIGAIVLVLLLSLTMVLLLVRNNQKRKANDAKNIMSSVFGIAQELKIDTGEVDLSNKYKADGDALFDKGKYSESEAKYKEAAEKCLKAVRSLAEAKLNEVAIYGYNDQDAANFLDAGQKSLEDKKYDLAAQMFKKAIDKYNETLKEYTAKANEIKPKVDEQVARQAIGGILNRDYKVSKIVLFKEGDWAVASVTPITFETDESYIALHFSDNQWGVVAGPGTHFDVKLYPDMPWEVMKYLND